MIQWLNDWLKQIILIILLATFIDLLLPSGLLQRYVKVIVSLFILLALLAPLLQIFRSPLPTEEMIFPHQSNADMDIASLEEVMEDGEKLRQAQQENSREVASQQASEWLQNELQSVFPDHDFHDVAIQLTGDAPDWEIKHVYLHIGELRDDDERSEESNQIVDVAPVMIEVGTVQMEDDQEETSSEQQREDRSLFIQTLHSLLRSWLDINPEQIKLQFD